MAILNDTKADFRRLREQYEITNDEAAEVAGVSVSALQAMHNGSGMVGKGFVKVYEALGYDIRLVYIPRNDNAFRRERMRRGFFEDDYRKMTVNGENGAVFSSKAEDNT